MVYWLPYSSHTSHHPSQTPCHLWISYATLKLILDSCCCSCSFKPEIIKFSQSSHKRYSNNIVNFQESTTISKCLYKNVWKLIECTPYHYVQMEKVFPRQFEKKRIWSFTKWNEISENLDSCKHSSSTKNGSQFGCHSKFMACVARKFLLKIMLAKSYNRKIHIFERNSNSNLQKTLFGKWTTMKAIIFTY